MTRSKKDMGFTTRSHPRLSEAWRSRAFGALVVAVTALAFPATCLSGTFGKVVPIGGHAADLALDEARGVLYVANFTANRIEVVSLADGSVQTSINVSPQPGSLDISPDGRWLLVAHFGNFTAPNTPTNALTLIDVDTRARQSFALGFPPLGVAFGNDGRALVVTTTDFSLFDPSTGATVTLDSITGVVAKTLPAQNANFPPNIIAASIGVSGDRARVFGLTDTIQFSYDVFNRRLVALNYVSTPPMGPRAVSVNREGSYYVSGWALNDANGVLVAQFPNPKGDLHVGSHTIDSARGLVYAQIPAGSSTGTPADPAGTTARPILQVLDAGNLRVRERLQLAENLAGKSVLSSGGDVMYSISDSGVTILPIGSMNSQPRVNATTQDIVFRGNFCDRRVATQEIAILDPGGGNVDFTLTSTVAGVFASPSSGVTPAVVRVIVDPNAFQNVKGTVRGALRISSSRAVNLPQDVRVLVNNREPDQRGTFVNVPGKVVDLLADPVRDRFFVLRQDTNEVLVYDGATYAHIASLRTGNTPTSMAITFDRRWLLIGSDNSQIIPVYDLETLEASQSIRMPFGHYPRWIAASGRAILAATRVAGPVHKIDRIDMTTRTAVELPSLGVYENSIDVN
ncbi:MAG: YncE family protein, partial [Bryobacteraceae bacterium]